MPDDKPENQPTTYPESTDPRAPRQAALQALLIGVLNEQDVTHDIALGALISVYYQLALAHNCCTLICAETCANVSAKLYDQALPAGFVNRVAAGTGDPGPKTH